LFKSFKRKKARYVLPTIALIIGISLGSGLLMVINDMEEKLEMESNVFGPNLIAVPKTEEVTVSIGGVDMGSLSQTRYLSEANAKLITDLPLDVYDGKVCQTPTINAYLYGIVRIDNSSEIIMAGTWFNILFVVNAWWRIDGEYPVNDDEIVIGRDAAEKLGKGKGDVLELHHTEIVTTESEDTPVYRSDSFKITGIVTAGGEDDSRVFGKLAPVQNLTNLPGKVNIMHISTLCKTCDVDVVGEIIEEYVPGVEILTVKQVTHAAQETLDLIKNLGSFIAGVAILTSIVSVMTTMTLSVVERRKEIGLMKTIGAYDTNIALMFLSEGLIFAIIGGIIGFFLGIFIAQLIGDYAFDSSIATPWWMLLVSLGASFAIVVLASVYPIKKALSVDPVVVLRGE